MRQCALMIAILALLAFAQTGAADVASWDRRINGPSRFEVLQQFNGEAVSDKETGLVWERAADLNESTWQAARNHCLLKVVAERRGWRLPAFEELLTLVVGPIGSAGLPPQHPFENIGSAYWTATAGIVNSRHTARVVGFEPFFTGGVETSGDNTANLRAWCVRGGVGYQDP